MDCRDCARYDENRSRCMDGKVNPKRYEHALEASQVLGLRAICVFCDHRERLVSVRGQAAKKVETPAPES